MKSYSQDLRNCAIDLYFNKSFTRSDISSTLNVSYQTICNWIIRYKETGNCSSNQHLNPGRSHRFTDKSSILKYLEANPDADGIQIRDAVAPELPMSTFYDTLHRMQITYKKRAKI
jgi:transposase